jgi:uncharacterized membrane protein
MLNWADLCFFLTVLGGTVGGFLAAHSERAETEAVVCFVIGGLLSAIFFGVTFRRIAYAVLMSKKLSGWPQLILYMVVPVAGLLTGMFTPVLLAVLIYE